MTRTLILTRHAKSAWDDPRLDDFERPLNPRGRRNAAALGRWLAETGGAPDIVLLSGAARTLETWSGMAEPLGAQTRVEQDPALYLASATTLLKVLRAQQARVVMMIVHNPGAADFAGRIARQAPDHPRFSDFPTGATAVVKFDAANWPEVDWGTGEVARFVVPRDLDE